MAAGSTKSAKMKTSYTTNATTRNAERSKLELNAGLRAFAERDYTNMTAEQLSRFLCVTADPTHESVFTVVGKHDLTPEFKVTDIALEAETAKVILTAFLEQLSVLDNTGAGKMLVTLLPPSLFLSFFVLAFEAGMAAEREKQLEQMESR